MSKQKTTIKSTSTEQEVNDLRKRVEQLSSALDASISGIITITEKRKITFVNAQWLQYFKCDNPKQLLGKALSTLITKQSERKKITLLLDEARTQDFSTTEVSATTAKGQTIELLLRAREVMSDDGRKSYSITGIDISRRKQVEQELLESRAIFENAFYNAPIGLALVSPEGRFIQVNKALAAIIGYTPDVLVKKTFQEITHPDDLETDLEYVQKLLAGTLKTYSMEKRYFKKDASIVWVLLSVSLVRDQQKVPKFFISQIQDITEQKESRDELIRRQKELEEVNSFMIGRELKMRELKQELAKLKS